MLNTSEVIGILNVQRQEWLTGVSYYEALVLTKDLLIVVKHGEGGGILLYGGRRGTLPFGKAKVLTSRLIGHSPEELLNASKDNYAIPVSAIEKVELKKFMRRSASINITTSARKIHWLSNGLAGKEKTQFSEYEEVFRRVFADKLAVSTGYANAKVLALLTPLIVGICLLFALMLSVGHWGFVVVLMAMILVPGAIVAVVQRYYNKQLRET